MIRYEARLRRKTRSAPLCTITVTLTASVCMRHGRGSIKWLYAAFLGVKAKVKSLPMFDRVAIRFAHQSRDSPGPMSDIMVPRETANCQPAVNQPYLYPTSAFFFNSSPQLAPAQLGNGKGVRAVDLRHIYTRISIPR